MAALRSSVATFGHETRFKTGFLALMYFDVLLTLAATQAGYTEMNPIVIGMLASPWTLVLAKGVAPLVIAWLLPGRLLLPSIGFMLGVAMWNVKELALGM